MKSIHNKALRLNISNSHCFFFLRSKYSPWMLPKCADNPFKLKALCDINKFLTEMSHLKWQRGKVWKAKKDMGHLNRSLTYSLKYSRNLHTTCTKIHAKRRWGDTFNSTLAEQVDGVGVSPSRITAHTSCWVQTLPTTHQEHLLVHRDATASLNHILQLFYTENTHIHSCNK